MDKVALGQVFPCQYHSTVAFQTHIIWGSGIQPGLREDILGGTSII